ncbi:MAG: hypothetical protein ABL993_10630 [Vicinamibacterales bacterium]
MVVNMNIRVITLSLIAATVVSVPAFAQIDLSGNWAVRQHEDWEERGPGPEIVDMLGLPINDEARSRALAYSTAQISIPERQCLYYAPTYLGIGPFGLKIWSENDLNTGQVLAWKIGAFIDRAILTIWMDGRPRPPEEALHPFGGFTTGEWEGETLTTYTTHFKEGPLRRNGVPTSDQASLTMHISRHGDTLTITELIEDPVYLTQPFVISRSWQLDPGANISPVPAPCTPEAELAELKGDGSVPHYLPGKNPFVSEVTKLYNIPLEAVLGGAETMFPEYRKTLKDGYAAPASCGRYCCGWGGPRASTASLQCITGGNSKDIGGR